MYYSPPVLTFNSQLSHLQQKSGLKPTQQLVSRLTRLIIETGTLTGQCKITLVTLLQG